MRTIIEKLFDISRMPEWLRAIDAQKWANVARTKLDHSDIRGEKSVKRFKRETGQ